MTKGPALRRAMRAVRRGTNGPLEFQWRATDCAFEELREVAGLAEPKLMFELRGGMRVPGTFDTWYMLWRVATPGSRPSVSGSPSSASRGRSLPKHHGYGIHIGFCPHCRIAPMVREMQPRRPERNS
jgi:hypothetical protein